MGKPQQGVEVRIGDDGEVLIKGPNIFQGYYKNDEATKETLEDGWLHTGDLGRLDEDGFLYITGRKKDIIITAGGKNITPANLENGLKQNRWISQAVVIGDRRPYLIALITLDPEEAGALAEQVGAEDASLPALAQNEAVRAEVQKAVDEVNSHVGPVEQIKRFEILDHDLSQETGELTPTLKVKRNVVHEKFADVVDRVYAAAPLASLLRLASNDPTDTGGLFVGRRPGTAPVRYREVEPSSERRRHADALLAHGLLAIELLLCLSLFGPQPLAWLWVGSQVQYQTGLRHRGHRHDPARLPRLADAHDGAGEAGRPRLEAGAARRRPPAGARRARADLRRERGHRAGRVHVLVLRDPGARAEPRPQRLAWASSTTTASSTTSTRRP